MRLSFVLPAFAEAENLERLIPRILAQNILAEELEIVIVDDHSPDSTIDVIRSWAACEAAVRGVRLARNTGSHMAILCGLTECTGDAVIVLAADGQDPPELASTLVAKWREGAHVVWAVRGRRHGASRVSLLLSRTYYRLMNRLTSLRLPQTGADFFLLDRRVVDVLKNLPERNTSIFALISWLGFRQAEVGYEKHARESGRSKWTVAAKIRLALDSFFSFSVMPLKFASALGLVYAMAGVLYAAALAANKLTNGRVFGQMAIEGWSALMVVLLVSSGTLMFLFGEYLRRTLEEVRGRPRFVVEERVNSR